METNNGIRCYRIIGGRRFGSAEEFDTALREYCDAHGCILDDPEEYTGKEELFTRYKEIYFQQKLHTDRAVRENVIGLDHEDRERIRLLWAEEFRGAWMTTYCGISNFGVAGAADYSGKAMRFAEEFFETKQIERVAAIFNGRG